MFQPDTPGLGLHFGVFSWEMVVNSDLWARVQSRQGLRSAGVGGTRKRGMGKEMGCGESARNSCLILRHFSGDQESGLYFQVAHRHSGYISARFDGFRTTEGETHRVS